MAINSANSNFVNISNLPQTQEAIESDLLVLQTENGTQTISFENFNVVKTDAAGNATVIGGLTGNDSFFKTISASGGINSPAYSSNNVPGVFASNSFYNRFTITNGIVTSATYVNYSDNDYINITQTILPQLTSWQNQVYKKVVEQTGSAYVNPGQSSATVNIPNFFGPTNYLPSGTAIYPYHFTLMPTVTLSAVPWVAANPSEVGNDLEFTVQTGYVWNGASTAEIYYRLLYFFN